MVESKVQRRMMLWDGCTTRWEGTGAVTVVTTTRRQSAAIQVVIDPPAQLRQSAAIVIIDPPSKGAGEPDAKLQKHSVCRMEPESLP